MSNQQLIDEIVADLLSLEPSFKEDQVRLLVAKFLANRPEIIPSAEFKAELYQALAAEIKSQRQSSINHISMFTKLKFTLGGVALVAVIAAITTILPQAEEINISSRQEIKKLSSNAFGQLTSVNLTGSNRNQSGGGYGGGEGASVSTPAPMADAKLEAGSEQTSVAYDSFVPVNYTLKYTGEDFTLDKSTLEVYQRQKGFGPASLNSFLGKFNLGLMNVDKFANANVDSISASEDKEYGYVISLDIKQGLISIYENWEKWLTPDRKCQDQACYEKHRLTYEQMPSDEHVINIANAFLDDYGINRELYGKPQIQDYWRRIYQSATDKSSVYFPDNVAVVYPFKIGDNEVFEQSGYPTGLYVGVNVRANKVANVSELSSQRYNSSDYDAEQDAKRLINIAEKGGIYYGIPYYPDSNAQTKTLNLGTPTISYVRMWQYSDYTSQELFVPSLIFPIQDPPADLYMKSITVPLVKSLLDGFTPIDDVIRPMPLPAN